MILPTILEFKDAYTFVHVTRVTHLVIRKFIIFVYSFIVCVNEYIYIKNKIIKIKDRLGRILIFKIRLLLVKLSNLTNIELLISTFSKSVELETNLYKNEYIASVYSLIHIFSSEYV